MQFFLYIQIAFHCRVVTALHPSRISVLAAAVSGVS